MEEPTRILILEDNVADAELVQRELRKAGLDFTAVQARNKPEFLRALEAFAPNLLLADYALPGFDGLSALAMARERLPQVPGIIVSGMIGEEAATEALKQGATDYVLKGRLSRLGLVVRRALDEARQLAERKRAEEDLRQLNATLEQRVAELQAANAEIRSARRAALNLMADALEARQQTEAANAELRREVAERVQREGRIARLSKLYAVLSQVNEAIVRTRQEETLYQEVCRIVVEEGGFPLAWVGEVRDGQVAPVAWGGPAADYLKEIRVTVDGELGRGPTGTCVREGRAAVNFDFVSNSSMAPWRQPGLRHGFGSSAAFPLRRGGAVIGALTLYAAEPGAFDDEQVRLLDSLTADVSYALDSIQEERRRAEAEQALAAAHAEAVLQRSRLEALMETLPVGVALVDEKGGNIRANSAFEGVWGGPRPPAENVSDYAEYQAWWADSGLPVRPEEWASARAVQHDEAVIAQEMRIRRFNGTHAFVLNSAVPIHDAAGRIAGSAIAIVDITALKHAEDELRRARDELERRVRERTAELGKTVGQLEAEMAERRRLEEQILAVSEEERRRIGQELHDTVGQQLAGVAYLVDLLEDALRSQSLPQAADATTVREQLGGAIARVRALSHGLYPARLGSGGLVAALGELAETVSTHRGVPCDLDCEEHSVVRNESVAIHLYRIAQEAVNNALKHAKAARIHIRLTKEKGIVTLEVHDNGVGIPSDLSMRKGLGVHIMRYRAERVGGRLDIERGPQGGTVVRCSVAGRSKTRKSGARQ